MTRFTAIALACLLVVPAGAAECNPPVPKVYAEYNERLECISMRCFGAQLLREAYKRGEISSVHLTRRTECMELSMFDMATGDRTTVPCTWEKNDF